MKAFIVVGPEGSGTRLATRILLSGGCFGSDGHEQPFDDPKLKIAEGVDFVWRQSVPHRGSWDLDLNSMHKRFLAETTVIVTTRDWHCTACSQVSKEFAPTLGEAMERVRAAYEIIFSRLRMLPIPFKFLSYEQLILHPQKTQTTLLTNLGLPLPKYFIEIRDENRKWL